MAENRNRTAGRAVRLGIFVLVGLAIFLVAIFIIGGKQHMFSSTFPLNAVFESVSGLKEGSVARLNGINVGTVNQIRIIKGNKVLVRLSIESEVQEFIKKDSKVTIISEGLVGNKIASISAGSLDTASVQPGDFLQTVPPTDVEHLLKGLKEAGDNTAKLTAELAEVVAKVNRGEGTIGQLINNESVYRNVDSTLRGFAGLFVRLDTLAAKISLNVDTVSQVVADITTKMNSKKTVVGTILTDTTFATQMHQIIDNTRDAASNLEAGTFGFYQNMEALKHNFLFKGYFEDIGYWDRPTFENRLDFEKKMLRQKELELEQREQRLNQRAARLDTLQQTLIQSR